MSTGSLLWIHGKRKLLLYFAAQNLMISDYIAGSGKSILWFVIFPTIIVKDRNS